MRSKAGRAAHYIRSLAALIAVATMLVVPPLLFAAPQPAPSSPRLARGMEPPPAKGSIAAPAPALVFVVVQPSIPPAQAIDTDRQDPAPTPAPCTRAESRRGPPSAPLS